MQPVYIYLGAVVLLMSLVKVIWGQSAKPVDWALIVAFIRLEFPPDQRNLAQKIAAGLAEIVGLKIKQLRPEHTIKQIAAWADDRIRAQDLIKIFIIAFAIECDENTTFRTLVEKVAANQARLASAAAKRS